MVLTGIPGCNAAPASGPRGYLATLAQITPEQGRDLRHLGGYSVTESFATIT